MNKLEERLIELESKVAFQDDTLRKITGVAAEQEKELYRVGRQLEALKAHLKEVAPSLLAALEDEAPPPHY